MALAKSRRGAIRASDAQNAVTHQNGDHHVFSVNTNTGALVALQYLNQHRHSSTRPRTPINSGLKVASAKDDGAIYAIAQNQRGAVAGYASVIDSLNHGSSAIDVALSAGQSISDLLIQLKTEGACPPPTPRSIPRAVRR